MALASKPDNAGLKSPFRFFCEGTKFGRIYSSNGLSADTKRGDNRISRIPKNVPRIRVEAMAIDNFLKGVLHHIAGYESEDILFIGLARDKAERRASILLLFSY
jgi:hypothetical protein